MTRLADTVAAELAQRAWQGLDEPGTVRRTHVREAVRRGVPGDIRLEDVAEWARPHLHAIAEASDIVALEGRLVAVVAGALILGARLQETNGT